jgi:hypothetical protein
VGRFLIEVPNNAELSWSNQGYEGAGAFIQSFNIPNKELWNDIIQEDLKRLNTPHDCGGMQLEKVVIGKLPNTKYEYFWESKEFKGYYIDIRGFHLKGNRGFIFNTSSPFNNEELEKHTQNLEQLFKKLELRHQTEIPKMPGYCFDGAFLPGEPPLKHAESISLHIKFFTHPDIFIRFSTNTVGEIEANYPKLLDRTSKSFPVFGIFAGVRRLHGADRKVGQFHGQELIERVRELNGSVGYSFMWEFQGQPDSWEKPAITLEMLTGYGEPTVQSSLSRKDATRLWNSILDSIRYRGNKQSG